MNGWKETHVCLPVILHWDSEFYFESRLVEQQSVLLLGVYGYFFIF